MADTQDIIVRYKSEVDEAVSQIEKLAKAQDKITQSEEEQAKQATKTADAEQVASKKRLENLRKEEAELRKLKQASKLAFTVKDISEFNSKINESEKRIAVLKGQMASTGSITQQLGATAKNVFAGIAAGAAAAFSAQAIINFSKQSIEAFLEAEANAEKLRFAITAIGGESEIQFERLIRQSEKLQSITIFSDDSIQQAQAALSAFGLTANEIELLIPKLADFATLTGTDIPEAANRIGAALEGSGKEFKKYGIEVSATATRTENLNSIMEGLTTFTGTAEAATKTLAGALKQQENEVDNLQETIGQKLAPAWIAVKKATFEATLGLIEYIKNAGNLSLVILNRKTTDFIKENGTAYDEVNNKVIELTKTLKENGKTEAQARKEALNTIREEILERTKLRADELQASLDGKKATEEQLNIQRLRLGGVRNELKAIQEIIDLENERANQARAEISQNQLKGKSVEELNRLLTLNKSLNDIISKRNVENIEKELEARQALIKKQQEDFKKELEAKLEEQRKNEEKLAQLQIANIEDEKQRRIAAFEREVSDLTAQGALRAKIIKELEIKLVRDLNEIDEKRKVDPLFRAPAQTQEQKAVLPPEIQAQVDSLIASGETEAAAIAKVFEDIRLSFKDGADSIETSWLDANDAILKSSLELFGELTNLFQSFNNARIESINKEKQASLDALDAQIQANTEALANRQINNKQEEQLNKKLAADKVEVEKKADKEIRKIQRQQAILDKANAIFQIALNTAIALADAKNLATFGALSPIILALGAAQIAAVSAQPIPGFKKGTKGKQGSGMALVGEEGQEFTYLPHGSKVVPHKKTVKYADIVDAMIDGNLDRYIQKQYVTPQLMAQKKSFEQSQSNQGNNSGSFAENVGRSARLYTETKSNIRFPSGMNIQNTDELATAIASKIMQSRRRLI